MKCEGVAIKLHFSINSASFCHFKRMRALNILFYRFILFPFQITGVDHVLFIQKNTLDRRKRVLKIEAWNESFSNHINIHELCFYKVNCVILGRFCCLMFFFINLGS